MGLISRHIEAAGIPTVSLTSARDITAAVHPPRAAFLDFPLGHTSGRVDDPAGNAAIVGAALELLETASPPSTIIDLPFRWTDDDGWKDTVMRPPSDSTGDASMGDERRPRHDTPQFQSPDDEAAAALTHAEQDCLVCAGIDY